MDRWPEVPDQQDYEELRELEETLREDWEGPFDAFATWEEKDVDRYMSLEQRIRLIQREQKDREDYEEAMERGFLIPVERLPHHQRCSYRLSEGRIGCDCYEDKPEWNGKT